MQQVSENRKIVIVGATSGIGYAIAQQFIEKGWRVGIAGRRMQALQELREKAPSQVEIYPVDVTRDDAALKLRQLIEKLGGMDIYLHIAGIGKQNRSLEPAIEETTVQTNVLGFVRMVDAAFAYFRDEKRGGQIAAVTSIAGTMGLGAAPSYSATKRFQNIYLQCLAQLSSIENLHISFTDIRPGFVDTDLLNDDHRYPMLLKKEDVAAQTVKAILHKRRIAVIDARYRLLVFFWELIPNYIWERTRVITKK